MNVALVAIGDEILIGQVTDTNSVWIAQELTALGMHISEMISISDSPAHITQTLDRLIGDVDLILMTGGLGPTKDDLTKVTLTDYFGGSLVMNEEILAKIMDFFTKRGRKLLQSNKDQALVPDNCKVLSNNYGTAPGMWFTKKNTHIISMPGVPYEMKPLISEQVIPALMANMEMPVLVNKTIMTHGVPESFLADMISDWEDALPACMKLAYLPRPGIVRLRLTVSGECAERATKMIQEHISSLEKIIGSHVFGYNDILLEEVAGKILLEKCLTLSTAESCTGGNIARLITSVPGSSRYFKGAVVAYSNETKTSALAVQRELIEAHGAVSKEVVEQMAIGVNRLTGSDISIATSGIAGPDGGSTDKPVGTVWIALAMNDRVYSQLFRFGGHRELVIEQASITGLGLARKMLLGMI